MLENSILYQTEPVQHFVDQAAGGFWAQTEKAWLTAANYF